MEPLQQKLQSILKTRFESRQVRNPGFSIRAFARELGIGVGTMSDFMNGKRRLSEKLITEIVDRIGLDVAERGYLAKMNNLAKGKLQSYLVPEEELHLITEWYYLAVLNLMRLKDFQSDATWIANRIGLPEGLIEEALQKLEASKFISKTDEGKWIRNTRSFNSSDGPPSALIRKAHDQTLRLALETLKTGKIEEYDFSFNTFVLDKKRIDMARVLIRKFLEEFCTEVTKPDAEPEEVYRISVQLFPLTKKVDHE